MNDSTDDLRARFEALSSPLLRPLYGAALRLTRTQDAAADLVQETLLRAFRTFNGFTPGTNARAWLFTIMHSVSVNSYRRLRRRVEEVPIGELEERFNRLLEIPDPEAHLQILGNPALEWKGTEAERALARLPEDFRMAVVLVDLEGFSYEEAAGIVDCPTGTLRSRLFRGRRILTSLLLDYAREAGYVGAKGQT